MQKLLHPMDAAVFYFRRMPMVSKIYREGKRLAAFLQPMRIPLHSAYTAFFLILSLFPALLLLLGLLRYTDLTASDLIDLLKGFMPQSLLPTVSALVQSSYRHSSSAVVSLSVLAGLWSASRGMYGLLRGLGSVWGQENCKSYWRNRVISVVYTSAFLTMLVLTLVLHVFGNAILDYLWMTTQPILMAIMNLIDLRFLLLLTLQTALFSTMYALLTGQRRRIRHCIPGAILASLGWLTFSRLFSLYVSHFSNYANIFGSVYALALGMLWLYFCICILFYGAAFNRWNAEKAGNYS
jgi:membrane protein